MSPSRHFHLLPFPESIQSEFQQPVRFVLEGRYSAYDILVQALGNEILSDVRHETLLVFLTGYTFYYLVFFFLVHRK